MTTRARGLHLLLVEDDPATAHAMAALLRAWGHQVSVAQRLRDAEALLDAAERQGPPIDLVISDINLPDGTGWQLMRGLRDHGVPGIALTGYERREDLRRSRDAGFAAHLVKPVDPHRLEDAIDRLATVAVPPRGGDLSR